MAGDEAGDDSGEARSLSYAELGAAQRISAANAKRLAIRRRGPKVLGNDGTARVLVPVAELVLASDDSPDAPLLAEAVAEVRKLRETLAVERVERARAEGELVGVCKALVEAQRRAEGAERAGGKLDALLEQFRKLRLFRLPKW